MIRDYGKGNFPLGHRSFLQSWWRRQIVWNAKLQTWRTSIFQSFQCVGTGILEKERWEMYDSLRCGSFECRVFISHDQFCKSAQYLRSNRGLVSWIDSAESWSIFFKHGELHCKGEWTVISKIGAWGGEYVGTHTLETNVLENLSGEIEVSQICESAGFIRKVSIGLCFRAIHGVNDGLGGKTGACGERTSPRDDQDSELIGWLRGHNKIGPVLQVRVTCCLDQYGNEIQVPSMSRSGSCSWVVISRGPSRYVDESWHDQEDPPQALRWWGPQALSNQSHAMTSSIEETHASKQQEQSMLWKTPPKQKTLPKVLKWWVMQALGDQTR